MKKNFFVFIVALAILLVLVLVYIVYKAWNTFGTWTVVWTLLVEVLSFIFLAQLVGSRAEKNGVIYYNPKEWPKFLYMFISITIAFYLFAIISNANISSNDYVFALAYLILFSAIPIGYSIYKLIRDRNDFISISNEVLIYKDNEETGKFRFTDIAKVEKEFEGIKLTFKDDRILTIRTKNMNFNAKDLLNVIHDIEEKLSKNKVEEG